MQYGDKLVQQSNGYWRLAKEGEQHDAVFISHAQDANWVNAMPLQSIISARLQFPAPWPRRGVMNIVLYRDGGPKYKTRDGRLATVLETGHVCDGDGGRIPVLHGRVSGLWTEWDQDGKCRDGGEGCDLVGEEKDNY